MRIRCHAAARSTLTLAIATLLLAACTGAPAEDPPAAEATSAAADATTPGATPVGATNAVSDREPVGLSGAAVRAFLVTRYGELAQLSGDWPGTPVSGSGLGDDAASREVCARAPVGNPDAPTELLAVCGMPDGAGHVTAAITDFFLLRQDGDAVVAAAESHQQAFGSFGDIADLDVRRFGAQRYGFLVAGGFTGQGVTVGNHDIVLPRDSGFASAASIRSFLDNAGWMSGCLEAGTCDATAAYDVQFDLEIDDSRPADAVYPLLVHEHGNVCGRRIDATHRLPFDAATGNWAVPPSLQRDGCD